MTDNPIKEVFLLFPNARAEKIISKTKANKQKPYPIQKLSVGRCGTQNATILNAIKLLLFLPKYFFS